MKLHNLVFSVGIASAPSLAAAGGLLLPGSGAVSTSRAGAGVASADDGEALVLNPAGIAKASGTTITISAAMIDYAMAFQRRGTYDAVDGQDYPYAGQPFARMKNDARPPLGIGGFQPLPVLAVISDLGGRPRRLHLGLGLFVPNAYPFRDMCTELANGCQRYEFNAEGNAAIPPPGTRYDIMKQEAAVILPSLAAAYRITPALDIGLRLSAGQASLKSTTALWATVGNMGANYQEDIQQDGTFSLDAKDSFVPGFGLGVTFRPTPNLEFAAVYNSQLDVHAKGTSTAQLGPSAALGLDVRIGPAPDDMARCATGGTDELQKACVDFELPANAQLAGRYKFLDAAGRLRGDIELDLGWEHWGKSCDQDALDDGSCTSPGEFRVVADSGVYVGDTPFVPRLEDSFVRHGLQDSFSIRAGGSYRIPVGPRREGGASDELILRGGVGYDTAAAKTGWLRADFDGAARTTLAVGAAYRMQGLEISLGGGTILEGSPSNPNAGGAALCNPSVAAPDCGTIEPAGPDPINPLLAPGAQHESPISQGDYSAHYVMLMLGVTAWF